MRTSITGKAGQEVVREVAVATTVGGCTSWNAV
jgi:hypothetical protein